MAKKTCFLLILLISFIACTPKQQKAFSPLQARQILKLQERISEASSDSIILYLHQSEQLLGSYANVPDSLLASQHYHKGLYFFNNGPLDSAAIYFHQAMDFVWDSISVKKEMRYFQYAWTAYRRLGQHADCITIIDRLKNLVDSTDYEKRALIYYFAENTSKSIRDADQAMQNNQLRRAMLERVKDSTGVLTADVSKIELKHLFANDLSGVIEDSERLLPQVAVNSNNDLKRYFFINYGAYLFYDKKFEQAKNAYLEGLKAIHKLKNNKNYLANAYSNLAEVHLELKNYPLAKSYLDSVDMLGMENISQYYRRNTMRYKLRMFLESGVSDDNALRYLDTIFEAEDKIYLSQKEVELRELSINKEIQKDLEDDRREDQIKNRDRLRIALVLAILTLFITYLIFRQRKFTFDKERLQMQQRLLRSQMNPHFTFNILYAIQNQIKKEPQSAKDYLLKFSRLLRLILENSTRNYVQLEKELDALKGYLDLQLFRLPAKFDYEINLRNIEEDDLIFIPPMLLQPLVENSIEHGFSGIDYKGKIKISLEQQDKFLFCEIEDNGRGLTTTELKNNYSTSTKLISDFLKKITKTGLSFTNKSDSQRNGLIIQFLIPYKLTDNDESDFD